MTGPEGERAIEALTVAMTIAPGVYARNRMFDFFAHPGVRRARRRAATLRGVVRDLGRAHGITITTEVLRSPRGESSCVLRYRIPELQLTRLIELSLAELAALRLLAARAGAHELRPDDGDQARVDAVLVRLLDLGGTPGEIARAAQNVSVSRDSTPPDSRL